MDAPHNSPAFRRREEDWALADRLSDLITLREKIPNSDFGTLEDYVEVSATDEAESLDQAAEEDWSFDGPVEDDFLVVAPPKSSAGKGSKGTKRPSDMKETRKALFDRMELEYAELKERLDSNVDAMKEIHYRLHAVICHSGGLSSGHYWVWIYDFDIGVWRKYNDAAVTKQADTTEVLRHLSNSSEPYYLCYVRDEDKEKYVNVPKRQDFDVSKEDTDFIPEDDGELVAEENDQPVAKDGDGDVTLRDIDGDSGHDTRAQSPNKSG
jgi:ubiquitin carboxyl-terminal hydrolase 25/28